MRAWTLRQWRRVSFTVRFAAVLTIMGLVVAVVPLFVILQEGRDVATGQVTQQVTLVTQVLQAQIHSEQAYATDVARQVATLDDRSPINIDATLALDSRAAAQSDVVGLTGDREVLLSDGIAVDENGEIGAAIIAAAQTPSGVARIAGKPWIVTTAPTGTGGLIVVAARPLDVASLGGAVVVADGRVVLGTSTATGAITPTAGAVLDTPLNHVVRASSAEVVDIGGREIAAAAVPLGGGFSALAAVPVRGVGNLDPAVVLLVALASVALLLIVVVVQADLHRPLQRLDRAAAALGEGDFHAPIPHDLGNDAVGRLARTFEVTRRHLDMTLRASRARAATADELNTPQPLRLALQHVCRIVQTVTGTQGALIVIAASEMGEAFALTAEGVADIAELGILSRSDPVGRALHRRGDAVVEVAPVNRRRRAGSLRLCALAVPVRLNGVTRGVVSVEAEDTELLREARDVVVATAEQIALAWERYRMLAAIEHQASTDDLTGLHNHRFLVDYLSQQISIAERQGSPLTVLMLDIDHFKNLNDSRGHGAGDAALQAFAAAVTSSIRRSDLAARYGGEEFVVVMANTSADEGHTVADKIRLAVAALRVATGDGRDPLRFTVSIGLATYPDNTLSGTELLHLADEALYEAKGNGRNRVVRSQTHALRAAPVAHALQIPHLTLALDGKKKEPPPEGEGSP